MLSKTIENQKIDIHLFLHQLKDARDILLQSMKRRKDMVIQSNEFNFKEEDTSRLFETRNPSEFDVANVDLIKMNILKEEVTNLKGEHEMPVIRFCEETKQRKKVIEYVSMNFDAIIRGEHCRTLL